MATATAIGTAGGAAKFFEGRNMQRDAQKSINEFEWQNLANPYKDMQVSTMGADLQQEEAGRNTATSMDAVRNGGLRAIAGNVAGIQAQNNAVNMQIGANLDQQQQQINQMTAGQYVNNQNMMEQRQSNELAGYGQMMNVGMGLKYQGVDNVYNSVANAESAIMDLVKMGATGGAG